MSKLKLQYILIKWNFNLDHILPKHVYNIYLWGVLMKNSVPSFVPAGGY